MIKDSDITIINTALCMLNNAVPNIVKKKIVYELCARIDIKLDKKELKELEDFYKVKKEKKDKKKDVKKDETKIGKKN